MSMKCGVCGKPAYRRETIFFAMVEGYTRKVPCCKACKDEHGSHYYELD